MRLQTRMNTKKPATKECLYTVTGKVQGVSYRVFVRHAAEQLGVVGTVENKKDGSVQIAAQGDEETLKKFSEKLQHGLHHAHIEHIHTEWQVPVQKYPNFTIVHHPYA